MWTPRGHTEKERVGFSLKCYPPGQATETRWQAEQWSLKLVFKAGGSYMTETDYILNTISMLIEADTPKHE